MSLVGLGLLASLLFTLARAVPRLNPWQDLSPTVAEVVAINKTYPVVLYRPDETITAQLDWHGGLRLPNARDPSSAATYVQRDSRTLLLVKLTSDQVTEEMRRRLQRLAQATHLRFLQPKPVAGDGSIATEVAQAGWVCWRRLEIPAGRRYGLFRRGDATAIGDAPKGQ